MRRGAAAYEVGTEGEAEELRALIEVFDKTHRETLRRLDENEKLVASILDEITASGEGNRAVRSA